MRCLFSFMVEGEYTLKVTHVEGKSNVAADALSRNRLSIFFLQVAAAEEHFTPIPQSLVDMLITSRPDWTLPE